MINQKLLLSVDKLDDATPVKVSPQKKTAGVITFQPGQQYRLIQCSATGFYIESVDVTSMVLTVFDYGIKAGSSVVIDKRKGKDGMQYQLFRLDGPYIVVDSVNGSMALTIDK